MATCLPRGAGRGEACSEWERGREGERGGGGARAPLAAMAGEGGGRRFCRICLDDEGEGEQRGGLIAPCACSGSQRWVHRECLDNWRAVCEDRAFSRCTECLTPFHLVVGAEAAGRGRWARGRFLLLVARDFLGAFLASQLAVGGLGGVVCGLDAFVGKGCPDGPPLLARADDLGVGPAPLYYVCGLLSLLILVGIYAVMQYCCSEETEDSSLSSPNPPPAFAGQSQEEPLLASHSHKGGDVEKPLKPPRPPVPPPEESRGCSCCSLCCSSVVCYRIGPFKRRSYSRYSRYSRSYSRNPDDDPWECDLGDTCLLCCNPSLQGACQAQSEGQECSKVVLIIAAAVFLVIGVFVALAWISNFVQLSAQRHIHVLHKRVLAADYVVADLSLAPGAPGGPPAAGSAVIFRPPGPPPAADIAPVPNSCFAAPSPPPPELQAMQRAEWGPGAGPAPSAPPLELMDEHSRHLARWGLL